MNADKSVRHSKKRTNDRETVDTGGVEEKNLGEKKKTTNEMEDGVLNCEEGGKIERAKFFFSLFSRIRNYVLETRVFCFGGKFLFYSFSCNIASRCIFLILC